MTPQVAYISGSTNRHPGAGDVSSTSLVAAGSSTLIALWDTTDPSDRGIFATLPGHQGNVTCVRFFTDELLISADDRGEMRSWRKRGAQWEASGHIQAHKMAISSLVIYKNCLATGSSDATVKIWTISPSDDSFEETQILSLQGKYAMSLAIAQLPASQALVLAIGSTDRNVQIWICSDRVFVRSAVLPGHEDWVRSLAFKSSATLSGALTLASGSQDATIRLWNIELITKDTPAATRSEQGSSDDLLDAFEASLGDLAESEEGGRQISLKRHIVTVNSENTSEQQQFSITFDALLVGHEAGVTSLSWRQPTNNEEEKPTLLSASTDSSLIMWSPSELIASSENNSSSIWINRQRFGDIGGQRLGGFVGALWASSGQEALAWGWSGGWRRWCCALEVDSLGSETWSETGAIGGHNGPVRDINWSPQGEYLISAGLDQTTRLHGPIQHMSWHELGRPQVHGYDLLGVAFLDNVRFVSIADEKVARVFEAHREFIKVAEGLGVAKFPTSEHQRPIGANVPPLGLSNKATIEPEQEINTFSTENAPVRRPFEGELAGATLWPEIEKVFGHGYESITLATSTGRKMIATACKATTAEHAVVRIYDTHTWQSVGQPLEGHSLTVTRVAFSPDDESILTVSRDRSWRMYKRQDSGGYLPIAANKSHARIIWDCAWAHEGDIFATASRDNTVKLWKLEGDRYVAFHTIKTTEAATAVSFCAADTQNKRHLAVGLENGEILIYSSITLDPNFWELIHKIADAHVSHIYRLAWRPGGHLERLQLGSCSEDGTLKVMIVKG